jgi:hypothetical protein
MVGRAGWGDRRLTVVSAVVCLTLGLLPNRHAWADSAEREGILYTETTSRAEAVFLPLDGADRSPRRLAPERGRGFGRTRGELTYLNQHAATGQILVAWTETHGGRKTLYRLRLDGQDADAPRPLADLGAHEYFETAWSEDGKAFVLANQRAVWLVPIDGPAARLALGESLLPSVEWTPAGALVVRHFQGSREPMSQLIPWGARDLELDAHAALVDSRPRAVRKENRYRLRSGEVEARSDGRRTTFHSVGWFGSEVAGPFEPCMTPRAVVPGTDRLIALQDEALVVLDFGTVDRYPHVLFKPDRPRDMVIYTFAENPPRVIVGDNRRIIQVPLDGGPAEVLREREYSPTGVVTAVPGGLLLVSNSKSETLRFRDPRGDSHPVDGPRSAYLVFERSLERRYLLGLANPWGDTTGSAFALDLSQQPLPSTSLNPGGGDPIAAGGDWVLLETDAFEPPLVAALGSVPRDALPLNVPLPIAALALVARPPTALALTHTGELWATALTTTAPLVPRRIAVGLVTGAPPERGEGLQTGLLAVHAATQRVLALARAEQSAGRPVEVHLTLPPRVVPLAAALPAGQATIGQVPGDASMLVRVEPLDERVPVQVFQAAWSDVPRSTPAVPVAPPGYDWVTEHDYVTLCAAPDGSALMMRDVANTHGYAWVRVGRPPLPLIDRSVFPLTVGRNVGLPPPFQINIGLAGLVGPGPDVATSPAFPSADPRFVFRVRDRVHVVDVSSDDQVRRREVPGVLVHPPDLDPPLLASPDGRSAAGSATVEGELRVHFIDLLEARATTVVVPSRGPTHADVRAWEGQDVVVEVHDQTSSRLVRVSPIPGTPPQTLVESIDETVRLRELTGARLFHPGFRPTTWGDRLGLKTFEVAR